jgi:hypothetical protein
MECADKIQEAKRYLANAKEILSEKAGKDGNYYSASKCVRMARFYFHNQGCGIYKACLIIC